MPVLISYQKLLISFKKNYTQIDTTWALLIIYQPYYNLGRLAVLKLNLKLHHVHNVKYIKKIFTKPYCSLHLEIIFHIL